MCKNNNCGCSNSTPCTTPDCSCPVLISSDCVNNVTEDLVCSNIPKGLTLTETLVQLDKAICDKFGSVSNFFTLVNVGTGADIYKGTDLLGKKQLRSLKSSNNSVTITEGADEIDLTVVSEASVLPPLDKIDEGNGLGIIVRGRITGNYGNIGLNATDLSYSNGASTTRGATGELSFAEGQNNIASGFASHVEGITSISSGIGSHAEGIETTSEGTGSHAEGDNTEASGAGAHSEGGYTTASGARSHAEGEYGEASGDFSHSEGEATYAMGLASHSEGSGGQAYGDYSHVGGKETYAQSYAEFSTGHFGTNPLGSATTIVPTNRLFNVGNGLSDVTRSDAFTLLKNGLATLPSVTNSLIAAASGKAIVTKEYLEANSSGVVDATASVKGILKLTGDLGGTADAPTTPTAVHLTGTENITGNKSFKVQMDVSGTQANASFGLFAVQKTGGAYAASSILNSGTGVSFDVTAASASGDIVLLKGQTGFANKVLSYTYNNVERFVIDASANITAMGNMTSASFIKAGGTNLQHLMADGSVLNINPQKPIIVTANYTLTDADHGLTIFVDTTSSAVTITRGGGITISGFCVGFIHKAGANDLSFVGASNPTGLKSKGIGFQTFIERELATINYYLLGNTKA